MQHPHKTRGHLATYACALGLAALAACAEGSIISQQTASLLAGSGGTSTGGGGGAVQGNVTVGGSDIALVGTGFSANAGQQLFAVIIDANTQNLLTEQAGFAIIDAGGNFTMSWKNLVVPGQDLYVAYYADVNGNAVCNAIPTDNGWEVNLRTLDSGTIVAVTPSVAQRSVCDLFGTYNITFDSQNRMATDGYAGHNAYAGVADTLDNSLVGAVQSAKISSQGEVTFSWPTLLVLHHGYALVMCVDTSDNGSCGSQALYTFSTNAASSNVSLTFGSAQPASSHTFDQYWPSSITLPPPPEAAIPTIGQ